MLLPVIESWIKASGVFSFLLEIARATFIHRHERSSSALTDGRKETWKIRKKYGQWSGKRETESSTLYFSTVFYPTSSTFLPSSSTFFSFVTICFFSNIILLFFYPSSIPASANHHDYSICNSTINHLLQNRICSSPYRADNLFKTWVGHKANFKVGFLQTCYWISYWNVLKWDDGSWKITGFLISLSLFLYGMYRNDTEAFHFLWTF